MQQISWRHYVRIELFSFFLGVLLIAVGCVPKSTNETAASGRSQGRNNDLISVTVEIDFGGEPPNYLGETKILQGKTVFDALLGLSMTKIEFVGKGETCFVKSINGVANGGAPGPNWTYRVNDTLSKQSAGAYVLNDGDTVLWKLGGYDPDDK